MFTQLLPKVPSKGMRLASFLVLVSPILIFAQPCPQPTFSGAPVAGGLADGAYAVFAEDLDGDGDMDVLSASFNDNKIAWYENLGGGNFGPQQVISTIMNGTLSVHAADLDGDGDVDVLSASGYDDKVAWYENLGGGSFGPQQVLTTNANGAISVNASDLDGDGDLDILSASVFDDKIAWFENLGGGAFSGEQIIATDADGAYDAYAADLDNDGDVDVLTASGFDDQIAWYENLGSGTFGSKQVITSSANLARSVYAADINLDGHMDVISASFQDDKIAWYENLGGGTFSAQKIISFAANGALSVYAVDMDNDGDPDVLSASQYDDEIAWYENLGDGTFAPQSIIEGNADGAISVYAADLDGDGDPDVLGAANYDDEVYWFENICIYPLDPGVIVSGGETICYGGTPSMMIGNVTLASGGDENISYTWRSSADNFTNPLPIATAPIFIPPAGLTQTTTYRRYANDGTYSTTPTPSDGEWTVTVLDEFHPGHLANEGETICFEGTPSEIGSTAPATGGDGQITYTWRSSADNFSSPIPGADGLTYTPADGMTQTTTFRRYAIDETCSTDPTPAIGEWTVTVLPAFDPGQIADEGETICPGGTPSTIPNEFLATGGDGQLSYTWRSSADNFTAAIPGADNSTYTPADELPQTTTFRRYASDSTCNTSPEVSLGSWTVTVADTSAPVAVCQDITVQLDENGFVTISTDDLDAGSTDDCPNGLASLSLSETDFDCDNIGTNPVTLTVEDVGGNTDTCIAKVIVEDNVLPTAVCQDITIQLDAGGLGSIVPEDIDNGSTDACGILSLSADTTVFNCADVGQNTVTLTVEDQYGNLNTCSATVTVADTIAPQALCQDVTVQLDADGLGSITASTIDAGSSDACPSLPVSGGLTSLELDITNFDCGSIGANPVTLTAEDTNGNTATCTAIVTVADTVVPEVLCQAVTVQLNANGQGALSVADLDGGSSDACGLDTLYISQTAFDCADVGEHTITLTAVDLNGNMNSCTATITVEDNIAPQVQCASTILQLDGSGQATLSQADLNASSLDFCGIASSVLDQTLFDCTDIGANTVTLTVTDNNGNVSTCTATVTIEDNIMPVALCQDATVQLDVFGVGILDAEEIDAGSGDACLDTLILDETTFGCGNVGTNTVTLTVTDLAGNSSNCTATVTVEDNVPPVAGCQDVSIQLDSLGFAVLPPADVENGSTDACPYGPVPGGVGPFLLDQDMFDCGDLGTNLVTLTVEDENNNSDTCTAIVTVTDVIAPIASCQDVTVQLNADGLVSLTATEVDAGSTDNCSADLLTIDVTDFDCEDIGPNPVILTVTDPSGNESSCSALATVVDNVAPQALCQDVTVQLDADGLGTLTPAEVDAGSGDVCGEVSLSLDFTAFDCDQVGTQTVTLTAEDEYGNSSTCTALVTVEDNIAPDAQCQPVTVQLDENGTGGITPAAVDGGSSDACVLDNLSLNIAIFDCSNIGENAVLLTATDVNGNSSSCTATVTVEDNVAPEAICQNATVQLAANGVGTLTAAQVDGGSTDACGLDGFSLSQASFGCGDIGIQTVTLTVTDVNGNSSSCDAEVTVEDNLTPTTLCQDVTVQLDDSGTATLTAAQVDNGSNDACGLAGLSLNTDTFGCNDVGENSVILTATDTHGNSSTCTAIVTVEDNVPPQALCQSITVQLDAAGNGSLAAAQIDNGSNDACPYGPVPGGLDNLSLDITAFGCDAVGQNNVVLTVTDVNGNSSTCTAVVTVEDNVAPQALCQNVTVQLDGSGTGQLTPEEVNAESEDACGLGDFTLSGNVFDCDDVGTQIVTLTVTDVNGNTDSCTAQITIEDNIVPTALCQDVTIQLDANGEASLSPTDLDGGSAGACGISSLVLSDDSFDCSDIGPNVVTLIVIDVNGNASTCTSTVTVEDNVPPEALCQDVTVQLDANGSGSLTAAQVDNGSSDACGLDNLTIDTETFDCADIGPNAVTLTATDIYGNHSTCSALITVEDNVAPIALCQDVTVQLDTDGLGSLTAIQVDAGSSDACPYGPVPGSVENLSLNLTDFDCSDIGLNEVTLTVTDSSGNSSTCTAIVTVEDNVPPTMVCNDLTVQLDADGASSITVNQIDGGSTDACPGGPVPGSISSLALDQHTFSCSDVGVNTITLIGIDNNGNSNTCTASVIVEDNIAPQALCQDIAIQLNADGVASLVPAQIDAGSNDACGIATQGLNITTFYCEDVGANTVALTVVDANGNASSCTAVVTVEDNVPPQALCQDVTVQLDAGGSGSLTPAQVDNGSEDACGLSGLSLDVTTFDCSDTGLNEVTLTVTDVNGNSSTCTAIVTVEDTEAPLALCQNATIQLDADGGAILSPAQVNAGSIDACGIATQGLNITTFDCDDVGPNLVILTLTDVNGNSSTCNATVMVEDNIAPVASCADITAQLDENGEVILSPAQIDNGSSDACPYGPVPGGVESLLLDIDAFGCNDLGPNTVILTVSDANGNSSSCTSQVTVEDNVAPTALCQNATVVLSGTGLGSLTVNEINAGSTDACGIEDMVLSSTTFNCENVGENLVVLTVTDVNGNSSFCSATVTVEDNTPPVPLCQDVTIALDADGLGSVTPAQVSSGFIDACGPETLTLDRGDFDCADIGENTVTLTQTDVNGNSGTCTATVTVEDQTPPQALCQNVTVQLNASGEGVLPPALVDAGSNDVCGIDWISLNQTQFDCEDVGQNTVTLTVADINGNLSTCTAVATVEDNIAPVAQCQNVVVEPVSDVAYGLVPEDFDNGSTDACGIGSFSLNIETLSCEDFGPNPVTLTVMDNNGNTSTCTAMAIVQDANGPTAICPGDITTDTDPGVCDAIVAYDLPEAVFVCDEAVSSDTLEFNGTIQTFVVPEGVTSLKIEAYGAQGGDANVGFGGLGAYMSGTFVVTPGQVIDVLVGEKPAVSNGGGGGTFVVDHDTGMPLIIAGGGGGGAGFCCGTIHDGAPGQVAPFGSAGINASGGVGAGGNSGNGGEAGTATQMSGAGGGFFSDGANGDCSSTGGRSYQTGGFGGQSGGTIDAYGGFGGGGGGYNCGLSYGPGGGGGGYSGGGAAGGGDQYGAGGGGGSFNSGTSQNNVTGLNYGHGKVILSWDALATVYINQIDITGLSSGSTFPIGTTTLAYTATDYHGNTDVCTFDITVADNEVPVVTCLPDTVWLDASGNGSTTLAALNGGVSDNCPSGNGPGGLASLSADQTTFGCADVGTNEVTLTAEDVYGNTGQCVALVTVLDTIAPVVNCESLTLSLDQNGTAAISIDDVLVSATDACSNPIPNDQLSLSTAAFDCTNVGPNPVLLTATDPSGNTTTCETIVTVVDDIAPVALCQDITIELDNDGAAEVFPEQIDAGSNDACSGNGLPGVLLSITSDTTIFGCGDVGEQVLTLTVEDNSGNTNTCAATVTIEDNIGPDMVCQDVTVQLDASGTAIITQEEVDNGSSDACGIASWSWEFGTFDCGDLGENTLTISATDYNGNSSTCTFTATVLDMVAPELFCEDITVQLDANGTAELTAAQVATTLSDACGLASVNLDVTTFDCSAVGPQTVTVTAEDNAGNSSQCSAVVTVADTVAPAAVCQDVVLLLDEDGVAELTTAQVDAGSYDACGIGVLSLDVTAFGCGDVGTQAATLTVTDNNSNSSSCISNITIIDDVVPVALCQDVTVELDVLGNASLTPAQVNNGSSDACGLASVAIDIGSFDCADVGSQEVTLTVEDNNGNTNTCTATVTVEDNTAPSLDCQDITVQLDNDGLASITPAQIVGTPSEGCDLASTTLDISAFDCADVGQNTVVVTAEDENGNTSTCTAAVTVEDNIPPVASCHDLTLQLDAGGAVILTPAQLDAGSSDACGLSFAFGDDLPSVIEFGCGEVGVQSIPLVVTDANGNSSSCVSNITIEDNVDPVALCQDVTVELNALGSAILTPAQIDDESNDACGIDALSLDITSFTCADVGTQIVTLTVEDEHGNTSTCTATVTVEDNTAPSLDCQDITVQLDNDGLVSITPAQIVGTPSEGCGLASTTLDISAFDCSDIGQNTVVVTAEDENGNTSSCTVMVTVEDNIPPVASCHDLTLQLDAGGAVILTPAQLDAGSSDACGLSFAFGDDLPSVIEFGCGEVGVQSIPLVVTDANGNSSSCVSNITIEDNVDPVALCQDVTVELNALGSAILTPAQIDDESNDACGIDALSLDITSFTCADVGTQIVTLTVEDEHGNTSTCTATVTVEDNTAPSLDCQDITVQLDNDGLVSITPAQIVGTPSEGCGLASTTLDISAFDCADVGQNTVVVTATDDNSNTSSCTAMVTVEDNIPPVASCHDLTLQLDAGGAVLLTPAQLDGGSGDACGVTLDFGDDLPSTIEFGCGEVGVQPVPLLVTDANGNTSTCVSSITIEDNVVPVALCQDVTVELDAEGNVMLSADQVDNGSNDACPYGPVPGGIESLSLDISNLDCSDVGGQSVTLTVEDENGNTSTCTAEVTVEDNTAPVAVCQNLTVELDASGMAFISVSQIDNGSFDACGIAERGLNIASFDCGDIGPNNVLLTVEDFSGNMSACIAVVTVVDNTAPEALCQDVTVQLDAAGIASLSATEVNAGSNDACSIAEVEIGQSEFDCTDVGANPVVLTVTDNSGNSSTCTATVTVEDNVAPQALCQDITVALDASGNAVITAGQIDNGSNDACSVLQLSLDQTVFDCSDVGENTVTLSVTDINGNLSTCTATVSVEDNTIPAALCEDRTVQLDASGAGSITPGQVFEGEIDPCGLASLSLDKTTFDCGDVGTNTVTLTATDVNGNTSTCTSAVTVVDNIAPQALCQDVTVQLDAAGSGSLSVILVNDGSNDACGLSSTDLSQTSFDCGDVGSQTVTLTVTDLNGNSSTCTSTVTVEDNIAPEALCEDVTVQLDAFGNGALSAEQVDGGSGDPCNVSSLSLSQTSFDCGDVGSQIVTLTATDVNGNSSTCTSTVTVVDNVAPQALCQDVTVQLDAFGIGALNTDQIDGGSDDGCGISSLSLSQTSFDCGDVGIQSVTLTATDLNGNSSTCTSTVMVEDNIAPEALCEDVTVQLDASGNGALSAAQVDSGSGDPCGLSSLSLSQTSFGCGDVGSQTVTLTVTDLNGNSSTCTSTVTVEDNIAPEALCEDVTVQLDAFGNGALNTDQIDGGSNDACPYGPVPGDISSLSLSQTSFDCEDVGSASVELTVTDLNGNSSTCTANVTVVDNVAPQALCEDVTVQLDASGNASLTAAQVDGGSSDACGIASHSLNATGFDCGDIGTQPITLTVVDNNGNSNSCTATVTVADNVAPQALCQDLTVQLDDFGEGFLTAGQVNDGSNDACQIATLSLDKTEFSCDDVGAPTVTLTATDVNGNSSSCTANITVEDNIAPVAQCQDLTIQLGMNGSASITVADIENGSTDACGVSGLALDITTFGIADVGDNTVTLTVTDDNDNSSTCTATVTVENNFAPPTGGIESNRSQSKDSSVRYQAKVFPNPTLGVFTLRFEQPLQAPAHAILRNELGQVISQVTLTEGTKDHRWANVYLAAGLYYLEVQHEDGNREILKIVRKQH
ncbi:HYR domain-containing protein [Phaeodactylibacter xiamenensis]|uniref:HYR domain-containing protein n=1 Tax=Phaeodactylibacter xiamenensis TaxID=1524460 RepID=UPI003BAAE660